MTASDGTGTFFGAKDQHGIEEIQVYITEGGLNAKWFTQEALGNAIDTWNTECERAGLPPLVLNWSVAPPETNPAGTLIVDYDSTTKADPVPDPDTQVLGVHPARNDGKGLITLDGRCPDDKGWDITCRGLTIRFIDWTSSGGEAALVHEIGHTFGLGHENEGCSGVMSSELNWSRPNPLKPEHCELAFKLNSTKELCQNLPAVGSQHSCTRCTWPLEGTIGGLEGEEVVTIKATASAGHLTSEHSTTARTEFSLPEVVEGASYELEVSTPMSQGTVNEKKSCTIEEPGPGIVPNGGVSGIVIECECTTPPPTSGEGSLASASESCTPPIDDPIFGIDPDTVSDICGRVPTFCDGPGLDPWWIGEGPWFGGCHARTCISQTLLIIHQNQFGEVTRIQYVEYLECICHTGEPPVTLRGPAVWLDPAPEPAKGVVELEGWARHEGGVLELMVLVDEKVVPLVGEVDLGGFRPDACEGVAGDCSPFAGFSARIDTSGLSNGSHNLQIVAIGGDSANPVGTLLEAPLVIGNECTSSTPPAGSLLTPAAGAILADTIQVEAEATAEAGVEQVRFYLDGVHQRTDWSPPYRWSWDTATVADGAHTLHAEVLDTCGNSVSTAPRTVTVQNANDPPQLALETPTPLLQLSGVATVSGWAVDADSIESVSLRLGTQSLPLASPVEWVDRADVCGGSGVADPRCPRVGWRTSFDTTLWPDGLYSFQVVAVDGRGASSSRSTTLSIRNTPVAPPTVSTPASVTVVEGSDVSFAVSASGEGALSFHWQYRSGSSWVSLFDDDRGGRVSGAGTSQLSLADVVPADQTSYRCLVANEGGTTSSSSASLTVEEIIASPTVTAGLDQQVTEGETAALTVSAQGVDPLIYQWQKWSGSWVSLTDDGRISGTATPRLTIANARSGDAAPYRCQVSNEGGTTHSDPIQLAVDPLPVGTCQESSTTLCFQADRFAVTATVNGGSASSMPFSQEGGFFWMFEPQTVEVAIKILDGTAANGYFWVFHGSLTDLAYTVTVTDTITGASKTYLKDAGHFCGDADTAAFPDSTAAAAPSGLLVPLAPGSAIGRSSTGCASSSTLACLLDGKFGVEVLRSGTPQPGVAVTDLSASFGFVNATAPEVVVKVIDGTSVNGWYWLFFGSLTHQDFTVRVTDGATGEFRTYVSPGQFCGGADTTAF